MDKLRTFSAVALCLVFGIFGSPGLADEVKRDGYQVVRYFDKELSRKAKRNFSKKFREYGYFSAFAVSIAAGESTHAYFVGRSDRELAKRQALDACKGFLKENNHRGPCKIYAEIVPSGGRSVQKVNGHTLSQWSAEAYDRYLAEKQKPHKAFVFTLEGAWAFSKSSGSFEDAKNKAFKKCEGFKKGPNLAAKYTTCQLAR